MAGVSIVWVSLDRLVLEIAQRDHKHAGDGVNGVVAVKVASHKPQERGPHWGIITEGNLVLNDDVGYRMKPGVRQFDPFSPVILVYLLYSLRFIGGKPDCGVGRLMGIVLQCWPGQRAPNLSTHHSFDNTPSGPDNHPNLKAHKPDTAGRSGYLPNDTAFR